MKRPYIMIVYRIFLSLGGLGILFLLDVLAIIGGFGWFLQKTHFLYNFIPRVIFFENLTKEICCLKFRLKIIAFKLLSLNISPLKAFMS